MYSRPTKDAGPWAVGLLHWCSAFLILAIVITNLAAPAEAQGRPSVGPKPTPLGSSLEPPPLGLSLKPPPLGLSLKPPPLGLSLKPPPLGPSLIEPPPLGPPTIKPTPPAKRVGQPSVGPPTMKPTPPAKEAGRPSVGPPTTKPTPKQRFVRAIRSLTKKATKATEKATQVVRSHPELVIGAVGAAIVVGLIAVGWHHFQQVLRTDRRPRRRQDSAERTNMERTVDVVDCSVFAPRAAARGSSFMAQVFLHLSVQANEVNALAVLVDEFAALRNFQSLSAEITRGSTVHVEMDGRGLTIDEPIQSVVWRGQPERCTFTIGIPPDSTVALFHPVVVLTVDNLPVGRIVFQVKVDDRAESSELQMAGKSANPYKNAFLSYSHEDRVEVLKRAQVLQFHMNVFQDVLSLKPGDRWEPEIFRNIDRADIFFLFWSSAASRSEWVLQEAEYALARQKGNADGLPDICPVILPPRVPPPESLKELHFDDKIQYLIAAAPRRTRTPRRASTAAKGTAPTQGAARRQSS